MPAAVQPQVSRGAWRESPRNERAAWRVPRRDATRRDAARTGGRRAARLPAPRLCARCVVGAVQEV
ncbi:hypothetical protein AQ611_04215 [Burkholderia singularis]|nr:hypothetical protein AQ611_04215 [Burkholderia sp. Bp7605]